MTTLCAECGERAVAPRTAPGRRLPWRQFPAVPVPASFGIPTCANCGSEWFDKATARKLDAILDREASAMMCRVARQAIDALTSVISQRDLESRADEGGGKIAGPSTFMD